MKSNKRQSTVLHHLIDRVKSRIKYVKDSGLPPEEITLLIRENKMYLLVLEKTFKLLDKPIKSIETVRGVQYKVGDDFHINGNEKTTYTIEYFPDSVTVRGVSKNPEIGNAWTVEAYIEDIFKAKKKKKVKAVKEKKRKRVNIQIGEYFRTRTVNTIYKALTDTNKTVTGINKLLKDNRIQVDKRDIITTTKKAYKKQHKNRRK